MLNKYFKIKALWRINLYPAFLFLSFLLWCFAFRKFLTGQLSLSSDALAYYEHTKFFIDQLIRGVYPMWDPTVFCGIPFEFYARRIGSFNPFYSVILILRGIGISHLQAYLAFLAIYFFVGMIGYFKLACLVIGDKRFAFVAFLMLMFSSLGTRLFDSYFLLTFIPMVWFFYFLVIFSIEGKKHQFLGMILSAMILFTTYLPFYFITVLISFIIFYAAFYFRQFINKSNIIFNFLKLNKIFVSVCLIMFLFSLIPGVVLFKQAKKGDFVLAYRHSTLKTENTIEVDPEWKKWSGMEDIAYSAFSSNLKKFNFAVLYLPVFAYVIFMMGIVARLNRKLIFLFIWGGFIFLLSSPNVTGTYNFLSSHCSYFKYFRNLHFFLWIVVLPVLMLFLSLQLKSIIDLKPRNILDRVSLATFITLLHGLGLWFFIKNGQGIFSTYVVFGFSLLFFILYFAGKLTGKRPAFLIFIVIISISQSIEVFNYLSKNNPQKPYAYRYYNDYLHTRIRSNKLSVYFYPEIKVNGTLSYQHLSESLKNPEKIYFNTKWISYLYRNINQDVFGAYSTHAFCLYDRVRWLENDDFELEEIANNFLKYDNLAYAKKDSHFQEADGLDLAPASRYEVVSEESENVKLIKFDVNEVKLKTDFSHTKFLVYNDSFYDGWRVLINGKESKLYRANVAFKGLWVPASKNIVEFKFGYWWQYVLNYGLLVLFHGTLITLIYLWIKEIHYVQSLNRLMHKWIKIGS